MIREAIERIETELLAAPGNRYVVLATTANRNNPPFHVGGLRKGLGVTAANFVFTTPDMLPDVVARFDGRVEAFLLDTEIKSPLEDLEERAESLIQKTPIVRIKPNDMTVVALDLWLTILVPSMRRATTLVVGAGNIGAKIALMLAERGAEVGLLGSDARRLDRIIAGLAEIVRGRGHVTVADSANPAFGASVILGCTPGVPAITATMIDQAAANAVVIDVGNGTVFPDALDAARDRGIKVFCLSPEAGFAGWMAAYSHAKEQAERMKRRLLPNGVSIVGPGVFGSYGEVLVDNPDDWQRIIGVCDGRGDILSSDKAERFIKQLRKDV